MPRTLTLIRHGESESNAVKRAAEKGHPHPNEKMLMETHTSQRRLTDRGITQAKNAGLWLRRYIQRGYEQRDKGRPYSKARSFLAPYVRLKGFVSPYARAMETAAHLDLPITWKVDARLAERNWGDLDELTYEERIAKYGKIDNRARHGIFWPAGNGETLHALSTRMWQHFNMLTRKHSEDDVIEVSHGETMLTQRFMLERWLPEDVVRMMLATDSVLAREVSGQDTDWQNKIINCRIIQYSREDESGVWYEKYCRVRMIDPSDPNNPKKNVDWKPIVRKDFLTDDLFDYVEQFPRILQE